MIPSTPTSPIANDNIPSPSDCDWSWEDDSGSDEAPETIATPRVRQADEEDGMQVDGAPVPEARHGLKRKWKESIDPGHGSSATTTDEPRLKRRRTGSASPEAAPPIFQDFHVVDDADFIELICKHGGRPVDAQGKTVRLALPKAGSLEFRVTLTCMKLERMLSNIDFPGKEEFIPNAFMEFVGSMEAASYANEAALVRRLLATGMGKTAGEVLEQVLSEARARGAHDAVTCLRAACSNTARSTATSTALTPALAPAVMPPPDWKSMVQDLLTSGEFNAACKVVVAGEDAEQALDILFGGASKRPAGTFFVRILYELPQSVLDLIDKCGGISHSTAGITLALHCADFDLDRLMRECEAMQSGENGNGFTALMLAAQWGNQDLALQLLSHGANPAAHTQSGMTALMFAARTRKADIARLLLQHGADVHAISNSRNCAMTYAAATGDIRLCELLHQHGALIDPEPNEDEDDDNDVHEARNMAPLIAAAEGGKTGACIWLVGQGASIETTWRGRSALLQATLHGHLDTCKALIALGARLAVCPSVPWSLLAAAAGSGNVALFQYFLEKHVPADEQKPLTPLLEAAEKARTEMLRFLLDSDADIDQTNWNGESALLLVARAGSLDAVELLLERGATCADDRLVTAAAGSRSLQIFNLLIARRKVIPSRLLLDALNAATRTMSLEIVKRLLELGAPTDPTDIGAQTARNPLLQLNFNSWNGTNNSTDVVHLAEILISYGAPLHHTDAYGKDPLMRAAESGHTDAVGALISRGARIGQSEPSHCANALQLAIMHLEDLLNAPTSFNRQQVNDACLTLSLLLNAMDRQENRSQLAKDAANRAKHRVVQDMIVGIRHRKPIPVPSTDLLLSLLDGRKRPSANLTLFLQKHQDSLLSTEDDPSFDDMMRKQLVHHGFLHPVIDVIMPCLKALPYMAPSLLGKREENVQFDLGAFCDGMLALLKHRIDSNEQIISIPYAQLHIDDSIKFALLDGSKNTLHELTAHGDDVEVRKLSPCFSKLFEMCLEITMHGQETWLLITRIQPVPGRIAQALVREEVYAKLAELIEAAWIEAWGRIGAAQADGKYQVEVSSSSSSDYGQTSGASYADEVWPPFSFLDEPYGDTALAVPDFDAIGAPMPTFAESSAGKALLAEFRIVLKRMINTPGTDILRLPGAPAEAEGIYSDLMFRQLHVLAQFIDAEPETDATPSSSAFSASMYASQSM